MIYLQSLDNRPINFDTASLMYAAIEQDLLYKLITFEELDNYREELKSNLFCGTVEFLTKAFSLIGLNDVGLKENSNRKSEIITLQEAKERANKGEFLFIKPLKIKLFSGFVLGNFIYSEIEKLPDDTLIRAYKPFSERISSEWRVYIYNHKVYFSGNYSGDFEVIPDYGYVREVIEKNRNSFPISYTIDVGILESGENVVVEYNDMWATGNYGVPNDMYLRMIRDRYFQIVRNNI